MFRPLLICGLTAMLSVSVAGDDKQDYSQTAPKSIGLEKMKKLVGTWVMADENGKPTNQIASIIKVTAGGSAVHETLFPGQEQEMISVYTADGNAVVMTHYCVLGNQPRMKAMPKASDNELKFEFSGGTNLDPKKDRHMHTAVLKIVDADHIEIQGCGWENGAPMKEMCCGFKLVRKK